MATNDAGAEPDDEGEVDAADAKKAAKFAQKRKDERARKAKRKGEKKARARPRGQGPREVDLRAGDRWGLNRAP